MHYVVDSNIIVACFQVYIAMSKGSGFNYEITVQLMALNFLENSHSRVLEWVRHASFLLFVIHISADAFRYTGCRWELSHRDKSTESKCLLTVQSSSLDLIISLSKYSNSAILETTAVWPTVIFLYKVEGLMRNKLTDNVISKCCHC